MNIERRTVLFAMGLSAASLPLAGLASNLKPATPPARKLGLAMVGLGGYATQQVGVGLERSDYWDVKGIVTGTPSKIPEWKRKWGIEDRNVFNYENFDRIAQSKDIDAVYICLPNSMHADFTIRAARAGKHVIVEKPMATSVEEAEAMIRACDEAGVKLAVGYRLHFNAHHRRITEWAAQKTHGAIQFVNAMFSITIGSPDQWRLKKALAGGGSLMDVGVYCVQAARYATGEEPVSVTAQFAPVSDAEKFREVEDGMSWQMKFPSGAYMTGYTGYSHYVDELRVVAAEKSYRLEPAFSYGPLSGEVRGDEGALDFPHEHHQHRQMEELGALFVAPGPMPDHISGVEGLKDVRILLAIYEAARNGTEVKL